MKLKKIVIGFALFTFTIFLIAFVWSHKDDFNKVHESGDVAPDFNATTVLGQNFSLSDASDTSIIYLTFLRFAGCPVCNFRVHELMDRYPDFADKNIQPILIYESSQELLSIYTSNLPASISIIPDPDKHLYELYEVQANLIKLAMNSGSDDTMNRLKKGEELFQGTTPEVDGGFGRLPADFIIYKGKILASKYGQHVADHMDIQDILNYSNNIE